MSVSDEVKQRIDIVELISRYTPLKRSGSIYKGNCPFHSEKTPSFVVYPQSGNWHCFGACGVGGDVFNFVMRKENLDFRDALQMLAKEAGVSLGENETDPSADQRTKLYELNELTTTYFQEILRHHPAAQIARDYVERRSIDARTQELFKLGYALDQWSSLRDFLTEKGYTIEQQLAAGLLKRNEERNSTYDAFRARLMIPIRDRQGRVIGFGGRILGEGQPKYLNTAETPLFHKSRIIYGLDLAHQAIRAEQKVVVVEGYMDVIAAHQFGYTNVVACMGTALTTEQLQQLNRYTDTFVLALDADAAGQQATIRGLNQARQALVRVTKPTVTASGRVELTERLGANLSIIAMPLGQDPDDVVRHDPQHWQQLVDHAQPLVDFYFKVVAEQYDLTSAHGKGQAVAELTPLIAELSDEAERQHYVQQLSKLVQIAELIIDSRVKSSARTQHVTFVQKERKSADKTPQTSSKPLTGNSPRSSESRSELRRPIAAPHVVNEEDYLLARLLSNPDLIVWLAGATQLLEISSLRVEDLQNVENQEICRALKQFVNSDDQWDIELFQDTLTPHLHGRLAQLMTFNAQLPQSSENVLREDVIRTLIRIRIQRLSAESTNIKFLEEDASRQGDLTGAKQFGYINNQHLRDLSRLQQSRQELGQTLFRKDRRDHGVKMF